MKMDSSSKAGLSWSLTEFSWAGKPLRIWLSLNMDRNLKQHTIYMCSSVSNNHARLFQSLCLFLPNRDCFVNSISLETDALKSYIQLGWLNLQNFGSVACTLVCLKIMNLSKTQNHSYFYGALLNPFWERKGKRKGKGRGNGKGRRKGKGKGKGKGK